MNVIKFDRYSSPRALYKAKASKPTASGHQVLIRVKAVEVTKTDCEIRSAKFSAKWLTIPARIFFGILKPHKNILGAYFSGIVEQVGSEVTDFVIGDRVLGTTGEKFGAYAEYVSTDCQKIAKFNQDSLSDTGAAALAFGANNALHFINSSNIKQNSKLLINGAGGSIGVYILQIAKQIGAEVHVVDVGYKRHSLLKLGADHFIDYQSFDWSKLDTKFDAIINMVADFNPRNRRRLLNRNGIYVTANPTLCDLIRGKVLNNYKTNFAIENKSHFEEVITLANLGIIKAVNNCIYNLNNIVNAHQLIEDELRVGPVICKVDEQ